MPARVIQQLPINGQDDTGLIRNSDEFRRHDEAFGALPAAECLKAHDLAAAQRHNRLVVNAELVQLNSFAQVGLELQPFDSTRVHGMVEHFTAGLAAALGAIHGNLGVPQELRRFRPAAVAESDANANGEHNLLTIEMERDG